MITNFEDITYQLTNEERRASKYIEALLRTTGDRFTNKQLRDKLFERSGRLKEYDLPDSRIRTIINYLRRTSAPNIIASSNGYKISENEKELSDYLQSLQERIEAINEIAEQTKFYLNSIKNG
jgi:hypothetical protein